MKPQHQVALGVVKVSSTEQIIQTERGLTSAICLLAFVFSAGLTALLVVISHTGIRGGSVNPILAYSLSGGFMLVGSLFQFWRPVTPRKLAFYFTSFSILGALLSSLVLGYDFSIIYPPWIILFFAAYIFFSVRAFLIYGAFLFGGIIWLVVNLSRLSIEEVVVFFISSAFMVLLYSLMVIVWRIADKRADRLEIAKKAEEVGRKRLATLINSMQDAVISVDKSGIIQIYNAGTLSLFDTNQDLAGQPIQNVIQIMDGDKTPVNIMDLPDSNNHKVYRNYSYSFKNSDSIALSIDIAPIRLSFPGQGVAGYAFIISDITKAKTLEEERQEFISVASHELRTPLAEAEGNLSIALLPEYGPVSDKATTVIKAAYQSILQLSHIVMDLTTLSEAERGLLKVELGMVDPKEVIQEIADKHRGTINNKGIEVKTVSGQDVKPVLTSRFRVIEILQNFVTNAIKYTVKGSITIGVQAIDNGVRFSVTDTGIGIGKADQKKIFQKFYRSEDFHTRKTGGTGLGLYIAQKLASRLNARITFTSNLGQGSTFYLDVPNYKAADSEVKPASEL